MKKRPRMRFPRQLSSIIQENLTEMGLSERLRESEIWRIWPDVVGDALACRATPLRIINGTLTVAVSSAPWMQELRFMTAIMKEKLNNRLGAEVVRDIVLKSGRVIPQTAELPEEVHPIRQLTSIQAAQIEEEAAHIIDLETRLAFIELMQTSMERHT